MRSPDDRRLFSRRLEICCACLVPSATSSYSNLEEQIFGSFTLRSTLSRSRGLIPIGKSSFLPSDLKRQRPATPWPSGKHTGKESRTSPCWFPTFWFLRLSLQYCSRPPIECKDSWGRDTFAR